MSRLSRARALMARPDAWLDADGALYALRLGGDRRRRPHLVVDEAVFLELAKAPGLSPRVGGGWTTRRARAAPSPETAARPGVTEGERPMVGPDGRMASRRANLTPTAIAWLAARKDAQGRPWLTPAEAAAGARLTLQAEAALKGPSMTQRWDAVPSSGPGSGAGGADAASPTARALAMGRRVEAALRACGPARSLIEAVCIRGTALQAAEQGLGLRRRTGRDLLKQGLQALARHYGVG